MKVTNASLRSKYITITPNNEVRLDVDGKWTFRLHGISSYKAASITSKYLASALHKIIDDNSDSSKLDDIKKMISDMVARFEGGEPLTASNILSTLVEKVCYDAPKMNNVDVPE